MSHVIDIRYPKCQSCDRGWRLTCDRGWRQRLETDGTSSWILTIQPRSLHTHFRYTFAIASLVHIHIHIRYRISHSYLHTHSLSIHPLFIDGMCIDISNLGVLVSHRDKRPSPAGASLHLSSDGYGIGWCWPCWSQEI